MTVESESERELRRSLATLIHVVGILLLVASPALVVLAYRAAF